MLGAICALYNTIRGNDSNLLIVFYVQINFRQKLAQGFRYQQGHQDLFILRSDLPSQVFIRRKVRRVMLPTY